MALDFVVQNIYRFLRKPDHVIELLNCLVLAVDTFARNRLLYLGIEGLLLFDKMVLLKSIKPFLVERQLTYYACITSSGAACYKCLPTHLPVLLGAAFVPPGR